MSDEKNLLQEFEEQGEEKKMQQLPTLVKPKEVYQAVIKSKTTAPYFRVYDGKGNYDRYNYAHLLEMSFREGFFTITTTTRLFTLSGKNLGKIADLFDEKKIKSVNEFNADTHTLPTEQNAIIIEKIERSE